MNVRFVSCLVAIVGLICAGALGDVTSMPPDPPISPAAQSALDMTAFSGELAKVGPEVDKLMQNSGDQPTVYMVRNWLVAQDPSSATNPFQVAYAAALNQAFLNALTLPTASVTAKINMGIVISLLAGPKANLAQTVTKLLGDPNPVVAMWGVKAAKALLPWALQDPNFNVAGGPRDLLLAGLVGAVAGHPDGPLAGTIAEDAYITINPHMWNVGNVPTGPALSALIDANLKLQASRLTVYQMTGVPPSPKADTYATYLFSWNQAWPTMTPAQQLQAAQQAANFIAWAGQRSAAMAVNMNQELIEALQSEGKWVNLMGQLISDDPIQQVGTAVQHITAGTPAQQIVQLCNAVFPAMQNNPAFTSLVAPTPIGGAPGAPGASPPAANAPGTPPAVNAPKSASDNSAGAAGSSPTSDARP